MIGLAGETVRENGHGFVWVESLGAKQFVKLKEPYISVQDRIADSSHFGRTWKVPLGEYFMIGGNGAGRLQIPAPLAHRLPVTLGSGAARLISVLPDGPPGLSF